MRKYCPNPNCAGLIRDGVVAEFVDRVQACLDCGSQLLVGESLPDPDPALEFHDLETVFIAANVVQGHLVAGAIEAEGIPVYIKGEMLSGAVGELPADTHQVEIQVPLGRVEQARTVARRFEGSAAN